MKNGAKGDAWTGVRNFTARAHLKKMKKGDRAFFYHTGDGKAVVGIVEVVARGLSRSDRQEASRGSWCDVKAVEPLPKP